MNLQHPYRGRVAKLAIALLENSKENLVLHGSHPIEFNMKQFSELHGTRLPPYHAACGTSCCFLGYASLVFPEANGMLNWEEVSKFVIGYDGYPSEHPDHKDLAQVWDFLFAASWPNHPHQAAARALYLLQYNEVGEKIVKTRRVKSDSETIPLLTLPVTKFEFDRVYFQGFSRNELIGHLSHHLETETPS